MNKSYSNKIKNRVKELRSQGNTYSEILNKINISIPKSTLSTWCKQIKMSQEYEIKIKNIIQNNITKARKKALKTNKKNRQKFIKSLFVNNKTVSEKIKSKDVAKIALSMLCLGEASKYSSKSRSFYLGSSDIRIIQIFINLLKYCFDDFKIEKLRCAVQCRADQDFVKLENYWQKKTKIPKSLFYKTRIDPRSKGKKTIDKNYKGVFRIYYLNSKTHLDLEALAQLIYKDSLKLGPVV